MTHRRVHVIGGGPAGLFSARQIALAQPDWEVHLVERLPPEDTFGFGVGLTGGLLKSLAAADPELCAAVTASAVPFSLAGFRLPHGEVELAQFHSGAIGRAKLLRILLDAARAAGVHVEIGATTDVHEARRDADLVVAADGVSSTTRATFATRFGVTSRSGRGAFIWCGAPVELPGTVFMPVETPHGEFVAHSYPYAPGASTFVIEASQETLDRAGFVDRHWTSDSESDDVALDHLSDAFADLLGGARFVGNRSRWTRFLTVRCTNWHHENVVLLGDAAATVHPSLGSGTKIALESAIALAGALSTVEDQPPATVLAEFEKSRRPEVERLQDRANRSQLWWESFSTRCHLSPPRIAAAYMSRAGAVSLDDLAESAPELATSAVADFAGVSRADVPAVDLVDWVLHRPLDGPGRWFPQRLLPTPDPRATTIEVDTDDPWGERAEELLELAQSADPPTVHLTGGQSRGEVLDRLALGERIRTEAKVLVTVEVGPDCLDLAADGLVAARTDLVTIGRSDDRTIEAEGP